MISKNLLHQLTQFRGKPVARFTTDRKQSNYIFDSRKELLKAIEKKDIELVLAFMTAHNFKGSLSRNKKIVLNESVKGKEKEIPILYRFDKTSLTLTIKKKQYKLLHHRPINSVMIEFIANMRYRTDKDFISQLLQFIRKVIRERR